MIPRRVLQASVLLMAGLAFAAMGPGRSESISVQPAGNRAPGTRTELVVERIVQGGRLAGQFWARLVGTDAQEELVRPYGVAWDDVDLLVADPGAGRVLRIDPRDRLTATSEDLFQSPIGIAKCAAGIVVADSRAGTVSLLDRKLQLIRRLAEGLERPTGVACQDDRLFVAETGAHRILELAPGGGVVRTLGRRGSSPGEFNFPAAIAIAGETLWIGDTLNFRLQRLRLADASPAGGFGALGDSLGETPRIKGITVDREGSLWVADAVLDVVALFSADGQLLVEVGGRGSEPGEFSFPAGIAIDPQGRVAVADTLNRRVQVLRLIASRGDAEP